MSSYSPFLTKGEGYHISVSNDKRWFNRTDNYEKEIYLWAEKLNASSKTPLVYVQNMPSIWVKEEIDATEFILKFGGHVYLVYSYSTLVKK